MAQTERTYVLAHNHRQAWVWARNTGRDPKNMRVIVDDWALHGLPRGTKIYVLPDWWETKGPRQADQLRVALRYATAGGNGEVVHVTEAQVLGRAD